MTPLDDVAGTPQPGARHVPAPKRAVAELAPAARNRAARTATRAAGTGQPDPSVVPTPGGSGPSSSSLPFTATGKPSPEPGADRQRDVMAPGPGTATSPEARYAAARAKALAAQARKRPADPQQVPRRADPRAAVAEMMRPCTCTHAALNHWQTESGRVTWCSIATAAGPCGCELYQRAPGGAA